MLKGADVMEAPFLFLPFGIKIVNPLKHWIADNPMA